MRKPLSDAPDNSLLIEESKEIARQTTEFLTKGGTIEHLEKKSTAQILKEVRCGPLFTTTSKNAFRSRVNRGTPDND